MMYGYLRGDLCQMARQEQFLREKGFDVSKEGMNSVVEADSYGSVVEAIFESGIQGWWNYKDYLISYGICTNEEFMEQLRRGKS